MIVFSQDAKQIYTYTSNGLLEIEINDILSYTKNGGTVIALVNDTEDFRFYASLHNIPKRGLKTFSYLNYTSNINTLEDAVSFIELLIETGIFKKEGGEWRIDSLSYSLKLLKEINKRDNLLRIEKDEDIPHINESYYGGRTEEYRTGLIEGLIVNYDINSAYAYVMTEKCPDVLTEKEYKGFNVEDLVDEDVYLILNADVYVNENTYAPPLPVKIDVKTNNQTEDRTYFPVGKFTGWWSGYDLYLAIKKGADIKVKKGYIYKKKTYPFLSSTVEYMYSQRKKLKGIYKDFLKSQLVRLYGLIARNEDWVERNRLIGSYITSKTRFILYSLIEKLEKNMLYVDTDSVVAVYKDEEERKKKEKEIELSDRLGAFSIRDEYKKIKIYGGKRYIYIPKGEEAWRVKFSGLRVVEGYIDVEEDVVLITKPFTKEKDIVYLSNITPKRKRTKEGKTIPFSIDELCLSSIMS